MPMQEKLKQLIAQYGSTPMQLSMVNPNGTAWFDSKHLDVLIRDSSPREFPVGVTLAELYLQSDILQLNVDAVVIY